MQRAIVCGAGAAGLASAACLQRAGVDVVVLERGDAVGASWHRRYPALKLNTLGWMSTLPGYRAKRRVYGEFPTRDDWIRYLEDYTRHHGLGVEFGVEVDRVDRNDGGWDVVTAEGARSAPFVVMATGFDHDPHIPDWPGRDGFEGELIHAADYRDAEPYRGRDVLVVGPGVTGSELAGLLAECGAASVRVATRTPPNVFPRKWLGTPLNVSAVLLDVLPARMADAMGRMTQRMIYGDLSRYGLPFPPLGVRRNVDERSMGPAIDAGFVAGVKEGRIEIVPAVLGFEGRDVLLADGSRVGPDAVICATGYRRGLDRLVGHLDVLDDRGIPRGSPTTEVPTAPGLFFVGYYARVSGQMRQMRFEARRVARRIRRSRVRGGLAPAPATGVGSSH